MFLLGVTALSLLTTPLIILMSMHWVLPKDSFAFVGSASTSPHKRSQNGAAAPTSGKGSGWQHPGAAGMVRGSGTCVRMLHERE